MTAELVKRLRYIVASYDTSDEIDKACGQAADLIERLTAPQQWIAGLPSVDGHYLYYSLGHGVAMGFFHASAWKDVWGWDNIGPDEITHWMPLPAAPGSAPSEAGFVRVPMESRLTAPAWVGNTSFGVGVNERLVIERAQREYIYQLEPERIAERKTRADAFIEEITRPAVPGEPSAMCQSHRDRTRLERGAGMSAFEKWWA